MADISQIIKDLEDRGFDIFDYGKRFYGSIREKYFSDLVNYFEPLAKNDLSLHKKIARSYQLLGEEDKAIFYWRIYFDEVKEGKITEPFSEVLNQLRLCNLSKSDKWSYSRFFDQLKKEARKKIEQNTNR